MPRPPPVTSATLPSSRFVMPPTLRDHPGPSLAAIGRGVRTMPAMPAADRPIVFLDVDGPLIPFGGSVRRYPPADPEPGDHPLLGRLDPADGPKLLALPGELVW